MNTLFFRFAILLTVVMPMVAMLAGCGLKGALYFPAGDKPASEAASSKSAIAPPGKVTPDAEHAHTSSTAGE